MIQLFGKQPLNPQTIQELPISAKEKAELNEIISTNEMHRFILSQEIWSFFQFDKKFDRISFAGKYSEHKLQPSCLQEMEMVFKKVTHFPGVKQIIIFKSNMRVLKSKLFEMQFSNLKVLTLQMNKTLSIQPLSWLNAEILESLSVEQNYITSIKTIVKCNWKRLKSLNISENPLSSSNSLHLNRMKFDSQVEKYFSVDSEKPRKLNQQKYFYFEDFNFLAKIQNGNFGKISHSLTKRIKQYVSQKLKFYHSANDQYETP